MNSRIVGFLILSFCCFFGVKDQGDSIIFGIIFLCLAGLSHLHKEREEILRKLRDLGEDV